MDWRSCPRRMTPHSSAVSRRGCVESIGLFSPRRRSDLCLTPLSRPGKTGTEGPSGFTEPQSMGGGLDLFILCLNFARSFLPASVAVKLMPRQSVTLKTISANCGQLFLVSDNRENSGINDYNRFMLLTNHNRLGRLCEPISSNRMIARVTAKIDLPEL